MKSATGGEAHSFICLPHELTDTLSLSSLKEHSKMPRVPRTRVLPKMPTLTKIFLAILAGSGIALAVAQALLLLKAG